MLISNAYFFFNDGHYNDKKSKGHCIFISIKNIYYKRPTSINDNYKHDLSTYMMASI